MQKGVDGGGSFSRAQQSKKIQGITENFETEFDRSVESATPSVTPSPPRPTAKMLAHIYYSIVLAPDNPGAGAAPSASRSSPSAPVLVDGIRDEDGEAPFVFQLGMGQVSRPIEAMVLRLKVGERATERVAAADVLCPWPPPSGGLLVVSGGGGIGEEQQEGAAVDVTVRLIALEDPARGDRVVRLKEEGNAYFKGEQYRAAGRRYRKAIAHALDSNSGSSGSSSSVGGSALAAAAAAGSRRCEDLQEKEDLQAADPTTGTTAVTGLDEAKASSMLNLAACLLQEEDYGGVVAYCSAYLAAPGVDPGSAKAAKAYFRRGKAHAACRAFAEATRDLKEANRLAPSRATQAQLKQVAQKAAKFRQKERKAFAGAFGGGH